MIIHVAVQDPRSRVVVGHLDRLEVPREEVDDVPATNRVRPGHERLAVEVGRVQVVLAAHPEQVPRRLGAVAGHQAFEGAVDAAVHGWRREKIQGKINVLYKYKNWRPSAGLKPNKVAPDMLNFFLQSSNDDPIPF